MSTIHKDGSSNLKLTSVLGTDKLFLSVLNILECSSLGLERPSDTRKVDGSIPSTPTNIYPGVAKLGKAPDLGSGNFARSNRVTRTIT